MRMKLNVTVDLIQDTEQKRLIDPIVTHKNKNVISLFSGCGGLDLGFEGGFKVL
jgi:DNA (cytosine-5)-methyltransferase 1